MSVWKFRLGKTGPRRRRRRQAIRTRTFLQGFQTLECNFELVLVGELGGVVHDIDPEKRNDRHVGDVLGLGEILCVVLRWSVFVVRRGDGIRNFYCCLLEMRRR